MEGHVHSFESMGTLDGPGIRFVVFLQGCPLRCTYCHNPDTWDMSGGEKLDAQTVFEQVLRYRPYFGKEGGVTVSGGEPLVQAEFVTELFSLCKEANISTVLDSSGHGATKEQRSHLFDVTDLMLLDIKMTTEKAYADQTGGSLKQALSVLEEAEARDLPVWIRHVVVPGITDSTENLRRLAEILKGKRCVKKVEFLPFHKMCQVKYDGLGIPFLLTAVPEATTEICHQCDVIFQSYLQ